MKKSTRLDKLIDFWYVLTGFIEWYRDPERTGWNYVVFTNTYGDILAYWSSVSSVRGTADDNDE